MYDFKSDVATAFDRVSPCVLDSQERVHFEKSITVGRRRLVRELFRPRTGYLSRTAGPTTTKGKLELSEDER